jgi:hypothetical protein
MFKNNNDNPFGVPTPYSFINAAMLPTPGARAQAYLPQFSLPGDAISGRGIIYGAGTSYVGCLPEAPSYSLQAPRITGPQGIPYQGGYLTGLVDMNALFLQQNGG